MPKRNDSHTREGRRLDAVKRQSSYDALSTDQKIEQARSRSGGSVREISRLVKSGE